MRSPEEAVDYLKKLHAILRYLDICDGNMEEGSFRCDANVSIRPRGQHNFGTRTEIKNVNSFRFIDKAIQYEINRQKDVLMDGGEVIQETRLWDSAKNITVSMRSKEAAHDYRYFPDPDLLPLVIHNDWIQQIRSDLPELPDDRRQRFVDQYDLPAYVADVLTSAKETADYFEACLKKGAPAKPVSNWVMGPLMAVLNTSGKTISDSPVSEEHLAELVLLIEDGTISGKIAKTVFEEMVQFGQSPKTIVSEKGLVQVSDASAIEPLIRDVLARNPKEVGDYKCGKEKVLGFFVGQVMKASRGKANPQMVNEMLKKMLAETA
jgi:aspartyl-tRNA(Asn)/glutamyl-tRNA(Gln) amidotransferase subunit B